MSPSFSFRLGLVALGSIAALAYPSSTARACSAPLPAPLVAFPSPGAADVSPQSSIYVTAPLHPIPPMGAVTGLSLQAKDAVVPITTEEVGVGRANKYLRVRATLAPATTYVLRGEVNGTVQELTTFTTAAAPGPTAGTAPALSALRLWQVHYTKGVPTYACAEREREGYIDLGYTPGSIPGTPPDEVVNVLTLAPKAGGPTQTFVFTGSKPMQLTRTWSSLGPGHVDPSLAEFPSPIFSSWRPNLEPGVEYCATLTVLGRNDQAGAPLVSAPICASVTALATDGSKAVNPTSDGGKAVDPTSPSGGCSVGQGRMASPFFLLGLVATVLGLRARRRP